MSESIPSIGVIVVNWNSNDVLAQCLAALHTIQKHISHTIVIDNCSEQKLDRLPQPHPINTKFIQMDHNVGFAKANNVAVAQLSNCEWIALINPDAFPDVNWISTLMDATTRYPNYSFFACQLRQATDPQRFDGVGDAYHVSGMAWHWGHGLFQDEWSLREQEVFAPCGAAALYRRDAFLEVGGFDEDFFCYFEDVDLGFRLRLSGHKCLLVPGAIAYHIGSATTGGEESDFAVYHGYRNMIWCFVKNMPGLLFWIFLPLHLGLNLGIWLQRVQRGQKSVILRAQLDAVKGLPKMWKKRKQIQFLRVAKSKQILKILDFSFWPNRSSRNTSPQSPFGKPL